MLREHTQPLGRLQRLIAEVDDDDARTIDSLRALGELRQWSADAEYELVRMAREELIGWTEIGEALLRPADLMVLLHDLSDRDR
jgi:hypothetical protein